MSYCWCLAKPKAPERSKKSTLLRKILQVLSVEFIGLSRHPPPPPHKVLIKQTPILKTDGDVEMDCCVVQSPRVVRALINNPCEMRWKQVSDTKANTATPPCVKQNVALFSMHVNKHVIHIKFISYTTTISQGRVRVIFCLCSK